MEQGYVKNTTTLLSILLVFLISVGQEGILPVLDSKELVDGGGGGWCQCQRFQ
jgi:hypothetical protein